PGWFATTAAWRWRAFHRSFTAVRHDARARLDGDAGGRGAPVARRAAWDCSPLPDRGDSVFTRALVFSGRHDSQPVRGRTPGVVVVGARGVVHLAERVASCLCGQAVRNRIAWQRPLTQSLEIDTAPVLTSAASFAPATLFYFACVL